MSYSKKPSYQVLIISNDEEASKFYSQCITQVSQLEIGFSFLGSEHDHHEFLKTHGLEYYIIIIDDIELDQEILKFIERVGAFTRVIILTSTPSVEEAVMAMRMGANDYLTKPIQVKAFQLAVTRGLDRRKFLSENRIGTPLLQVQSRSEMNRNFQMSKEEMPFLRQGETEDRHLMFVDDVTGLFNTRYLNYVLDFEIDRSKESNQSFAILFIDTDFFKIVNDSYGHRVGTKLLHELGAQLRKYVREVDTVFRYGGDEFVAVLSPSDAKTAQIVAERIRNSVEKEEFLKSEKLSIHLTVSIGIALFPEHARDSKELIEAADQAMYFAKKSQKNCISIAQGTSPLSKSDKGVIIG